MRDFGDWFANPNRLRPPRHVAAVDPALRERVLAAIRRVRDGVGLHSAPHAAEQEQEIVGAYLDAVEDALLEILDGQQEKPE